MTATIEELLAEASLPTANPDSFDVGAALRRLSADAARTTPPPDMARAAQAGQHLRVVCRWIINAPAAAGHVDQLAGDERRAPVAERQLDEEGALVFACLLYLTGHPESAQFWWQLAGGAGHRVAAYCLHLHHLSLGESREAQHWRHQVIHSLSDDGRPDDDRPDDQFLKCLEVIADYVRENGSKASAPNSGLEMEVDRLAEDDDTRSCGIVHVPDRRLAHLLREFTRR